MSSSHKRKSLSIREKIEIIKHLESGVKNKEISKRFGLPSSTVSTLRKNKDIYLNASREDNNSESKKFRKCHLPDVDEALIKWFREKCNEGFPIHGPILKAQAVTFARMFGHKEFVCNNGWIDRFRKRHNIVYSLKGRIPKSSKKWLREVSPEADTDLVETVLQMKDEIHFEHTNHAQWLGGVWPEDTVLKIANDISDDEINQEKNIQMALSNQTQMESKNIPSIHEAENALDILKRFFDCNEWLTEESVSAFSILKDNLNNLKAPSYKQSSSTILNCIKIKRSRKQKYPVKCV